jgi:hypothetical protein
MSFKLKEVLFRVKCGEPGCPFSSDFLIKENLMGATEADIDQEVWKIAKNLAYNKHDSLYGRRHPLTNPDIKKVSGQYERIGQQVDLELVTSPVRPIGPSPQKTYRKGDKIIRKGDKAGTICEVVRGSARNEDRPDLVYRQGSTFGFAALLENKDRMADIVAAEEGTVIASYNLKDLSKADPAKARSMYNEAMEDIFRVMEYLEDLSKSLEKQADRLRSENGALKKAAAAKKPAAAKEPVKNAVKVKAPAKKPAGKKKAPAKKLAAKKPAKRK